MMDGEGTNSNNTTPKKRGAGAMSPEPKKELIFSDLSSPKKQKDLEGNPKLTLRTPPSSPMSSPVRNLLASATLSSPVRLSVPTVYSIVKNLPNANILWRIMDTVPGEEFIADHKKLCELWEVFLEENKQYRKKSRHEDLPERILNAITRSRSVYYTATWRELEEQQLKVFHLAHTVLHEKITGKPAAKRSGKTTGNTASAPKEEIWHTKKAEELNNSINDLTGDIESLLFNVTIGKPLLSLLDNFNEYLNLHGKLLSAAISYPTGPVITQNTPVREKLVNIVDKWHAGINPEKIAAIKAYAGSAKLAKTPVSSLEELASVELSNNPDDAAAGFSFAYPPTP